MRTIKNGWKIVIILLTWLLFVFIRSIGKKRAVKYNKILVLYISGVGDTICLTPFYQKIKEKFPDAELWSCFPSGVVELQDCFFTFDGSIRHNHCLKTIREIRKQKFDMVILPGWVLKNSILALLSGAREVLGYINELTFSNRYLNRFVLQSTNPKVITKWQNMKNCHLSERANLILEHFSIAPVKADKMSFIRTQDSEGYAVIHAGAQFKGRRWHPSNFARILDYLFENRVCTKVCLIGSKEDVIINQQIISISDNPSIIDQSGKLSLLETKKLIDKAELFIGNDSGPMHIAAMSGIPTIGLLGPNFPYVSGPVGKQNTVVFNEISCTGCNQRGCLFGYKCINSITVEQVVLAIRKVMNEN